MKELYRYLFFGLLIVVFGFFVYPTLYKYDKLDQRYPVKINRITGDAHVLRGESWEKVNNETTVSEIEKIRQDIETKIENEREAVKDDVVSSVKDAAVQAAVEDSKAQLEQILSEIESAKQEVMEYKQFKKDPGNYFTLGSSDKEVKNIMGTPDTISGYAGHDRWNYGNSSVSFVDGKVTGWQDLDGNLMTK